MRLSVSREKIRILSECAVPGCVRGVSAASSRENFEDAAGSAEGGGAILASVIGRVLAAIEGREIPVEGLDELPPMICEPHMIELLELRRSAGEPGPDAGDRRGEGGATFEIEDAGEGDDDDEG